MNQTFKYKNIKIIKCVNFIITYYCIDCYVGLAILCTLDSLSSRNVIRYVRFFYRCMYICSFMPLAYAECEDSLPFSAASSIPLCYALFPATLLHQLFLHPLSPHLAIYFLVYLSIFLFPHSYISFWEFYFLPFSVNAQTNVIYFFLSLL